MRLFVANLHGTLCCRSVLFPVGSPTRNYRGKVFIYTVFVFLNFQLFCWVFWIYHNWSFCHLSVSFCYLLWTVLPPTGEIFLYHIRIQMILEIIQKYICKLFLDKETITYYILGGIFANFLGLFVVFLRLSASFCVFPGLSGI